jgi:thiosulfate dehydrogenase
MRSLNGKAPPPDSQVAESLIAYFNWISKEVSDIKDPPWRGLKELKSTKEPSAANGKRLYQQKCATCHGKEGQGLSKNHNTIQIPPLWGPNSYNDGAGMNRLEVLSSFIYCNMPFENPTLTEEEAFDVASFVIEQERPHFNENNAP